MWKIFDVIENKDYFFKSSRNTPASEQVSWLPSPPIVEKNMCIIYVVVVAADMSENDAEDMSEDDDDDVDDDVDVDVDDDVDVDVDVDDDDEEGGEEGGEGHAQRKS